MTTTHNLLACWTCCAIAIAAALFLEGTLLGTILWLITITAGLYFLIQLFNDSP